jgi:tol-pal system protein YbgF
MKPKIYFCLLIAFAPGLSPAFAGTKEELMRLQSDVLALQNQMREFEKTLNERTDGLKSLVEQLNDQVAKSNLILGTISKTMENQASGARSTDQSLLQEIRALSAKIDDANTRISAMAQQLADLKVQAKPIQGGGTSEDSIYNQAFADLVQGNFDLAIQGFTAYLSSFPGGEKAASAQYNIGEAYYSQNKLPQAIAAFTRVINDYPGMDKTPTALFRRAKAELAMQETKNAIADFREVVEKYPQATEAGLAKDELQKLGVSATKPAPTRRKTR